MADPASTASAMRSNANMYPRSAFSSTGVSSPNSSFRNDVFGQAFSPNASSYSTSPNTERYSSERNGPAPPLSATTSDPLAFGQEGRQPSAIIIRRLSRTTSRETLASMLIFAGDLIDTEFIRSPYMEDSGYATALARFQSQAGAMEAQQKLHGKPNTTKEASMIVEVHGGGLPGSFERRNTIDGTTNRTQTSSASSGGSVSRSRYGSTFQSPDKVSPPLQTPSSGASSEFRMPETSSHFQNLFSPHSPLANGFDDRQRVSGKYTISNDTPDDETGELLKDPVAYAKSGQQHPTTRRPTNPQIPLTRFANLSLATNTNGSISPNISSPSNGLSSPRPTHPHSPHLAYPRHQYPPVNPADQNPPCNTLYVGNLPLDTAEDELKAVFSKQRGYKRLCFRTKQNGPMCFVEFEDVSFATKALHELYGYPLSNSSKGGIRLSFSKNPLGVRSGQVGGGVAMNPTVMAPGYGPGFSAVSGPPPGLGAGMGGPGSGMGGPGGGMGGGAMGVGGPGGSYHRGQQPLDSLFANPFGMPAQDFHPRSQAGYPPQMAMNGVGYSKDGGRPSAGYGGGGGGEGGYAVGR